MTDLKLKKCLLLLSVLLAVGCMAAGARRGPKAEKVTAGVLGRETVEEIKSQRQEYEETDKRIGELYYKEVRLPYSAYNASCYLSVTGDFSPEADDFRVEFGPDMSRVEAAFEMFPEEEELELAVREGTRYPVLLYNDDYYQECYVVFSGMPVLDIAFTDETDGDYTIVRATLQSGTFDEGRIVESDAKMRIRGGISRNFPKLGFKLKLIEQDPLGNQVKRRESLLGMRRDNTWNLSALYADDTKIRDKVAIDLWAEMSAEKIPFPETFGTRMEYVEVLMNDQYMGMYGLLEPIDEQQLGITDGGESGLFEYYYKKEGETVAEDGDFLFESVDVRVPLKEEGVPDMIVAGLELKNGYGHSARVAWEPVRRYMAMVREETFERDAQQLLDMDNVADIWILIQAIAGVDNRAKNLYYCAKVVNGDYRLYFVPWDFDMSWGVDTDVNSPTLQSYYTYDVNRILTWSPGTQLIEQNVGNIRDLIRERWTRLRAGALSEEALIGSMEEEISYLLSSGAYERDKERWEESPHTDDFERIKTYARERLKAVDDYIDGM